jgi:hypothetical protein
VDEKEAGVVNQVAGVKHVMDITQASRGQADC